MDSTKHTTVVQQTVEQIKHFLFTSNLEKGQHLPSEKRMCAQIGVSRNSLREALRILAATGYITLEPGRGAFALRTNEFDEDENTIAWFAQNEVEVQDYLEIRSVCEPLAAKLAIERCTQKDIERLHVIHSSFLRAVEIMDKEEIIIQESDFHDTIIELSKNKLLISLFKVMRKRMIDFRYQSLRLPNAPQDAVVPHSRIIRAFDLHDPELGEVAMREHIKLGIYNYKIAMVDAELN